MKYIVTVDPALVEAEDPYPIRVEDILTGEVYRVSGGDIVQGRIVAGPQRRDGARVWIECEDVLVDPWERKL